MVISEYQMRFYLDVWMCLLSIPVGFWDLELACAHPFAWFLSRFNVPCFEISHEIPTFVFVLKLVFEFFFIFIFLELILYPSSLRVWEMRLVWTHLVPICCALFWLYSSVFRTHPYHASDLPLSPDEEGYYEVHNHVGLVLVLSCTEMSHFSRGEGYYEVHDHVGSVLVLSCTEMSQFSRGEGYKNGINHEWGWCGMWWCSWF